MIVNKINAIKIPEIKYEFDIYVGPDRRIVFVTVRSTDINVEDTRCMTEKLIKRLLQQQYMKFSFQSATLWGVSSRMKMSIECSDIIHGKEAVAMGESVGLDLATFRYRDEEGKPKRYIVTYINDTTF